MMTAESKLIMYRQVLLGVPVDTMPRSIAMIPVDSTYFEAPLIVSGKSVIIKYMQGKSKTGSAYGNSYRSMMEEMQYRQMPLTPSDIPTPVLVGGLGLEQFMSVISRPYSEDEILEWWEPVGFSLDNQFTSTTSIPSLANQIQSAVSGMQKDSTDPSKIRHVCVMAVNGQNLMIGIIPMSEYIDEEERAFHARMDFLNPDTNSE